jgi:hypothetical protein
MHAGIYHDSGCKHYDPGNNHNRRRKQFDPSNHHDSRKWFDPSNHHDSRSNQYNTRSERYDPGKHHDCDLSGMHRRLKSPPEWLELFFLYPWKASGPCILQPLPSIPSTELWS